MKRRKAVLWLFAIAAGMALVFYGAFGLFEEPPYDEYEDGVYTGEAEGIRKHLKVEVTMKGGYIADVQVVEHYEKGAYRYEEPISTIPEEIVRRQSPDVDAVAGSTLTSNGIMDAVRDALAEQ